MDVHFMSEKMDIKRFEEKFTPVTESGCWVWVACVNEKGYGLFKVGGKRGKAEKAHRFSYRNYVGEIPDGMHVLHKCDMRCCVNPDRLFVGTHQENMADRDRKGRGVLKPGYDWYKLFGDKR